MTLLQLLFSFLQIGLLSIGGGYAALPIIQDQVVAMHGWLSMREFAESYGFCHKNVLNKQV